ncbi:putative manganese transporter [Halocatena salina]|uniref:Putative manganese transporter n=1 Tax=Halocatena salina TaxID=2934340 RepID=A0A8U0A597_9EURY|nr:putative manganese transporter [Halocatena salina]UPM43123.1 putative manganese transporter [Halocatena salina]
MLGELWEIFVLSVRDGFVQVSAFVAITVFLFSYIQYKTDGQLIGWLESNRRAQPIVGALLGLTPGCGGAIVVMPLYIRGSVTFGTVVATLIATAGDSAFVILALAPEAALYAYGIGFAVAILSGYAVDRFGFGVDRIDQAVSQLSPTVTDGGTVANGGVVQAETNAPAGVGSQVHHYPDESCDHGSATRESPFMTKMSQGVLALWWVIAIGALVAGVMYLVRGAPEIPLVANASFAGVFTVVGIVGTVLSFYLYFVGRRYIGHGRMEQASDAFDSAREALTHAAMETSFVTVWVLAAYLVYEYSVVLFSLDIAGVAAAAGLGTPVAGAALGLIPGCGPQIVLATAYSEGSIPFSALTANAISQDGDALFPLIAMDKKAAIIASIYTTVPALLVGVGLHLLVGPMFGFGVLGG